MPSRQFTLGALLMAMLVVGAFFGGLVVQRGISNEPVSIQVRATYDQPNGDHVTTKVLLLPDGIE